VHCFGDRCLSLFFWSLYCLSFFHLRILFTPIDNFNLFLPKHLLVSSNPLSRNPWEKPQALEYLISWEINHAVERMQFYLYVLKIVVCPFVLFRLAIVLSLLLRFTDSDYPFGIIELFFAKMILPQVKRCYLWMGFPVYKEWLIWFKCGHLCLQTINHINHVVSYGGNIIFAKKTVVSLRDSLTEGYC
jgi:hypothetical protein